MTSSEPVGPGVPPAPDDESGGSRWWVVVTLVVLAVVAVALLVAQPWVDHETEPIVVSTSTGAPSSPAATTPPAPSPTPSATPTTPPVPGADAVFDDSNVRSLLVRKADLEADVPAAADGIDVGIPTGELLWGLPEGSSVEPAECTIAVTVVATEPPGFVGRSYVNDRVDFVQQVVRLADPAAAQEAFRELVTTVDGCPQYSQVNPGIDGATWTAEPAIEGQGVYPAVVQEVLHSAEGVDAPSYRGHVLVGNTIVTWTATALGEGDREELLASLGTPESLSTMVQNRAHEAVQALG